MTAETTGARRDELVNCRSALARGVVMNHETAASKAKEIADHILAPAAKQNDKDAKRAGRGCQRKQPSLPTRRFRRPRPEAQPNYFPVSLFLGHLLGIWIRIRGNL